MGAAIGRLLGVAAFAAAAPVLAASICTPIGEGQQRCRIAKVADCSDIDDYPYARNLFCPATFNAVQAMVKDVAKTLGVNGPADGFFHFYQTLPDPDAQSTVACMDTVAPYPGGSKWVKGAGTPLCHLVAHVTSAGPDDAKKGDKGNPVPGTLRTFPDYFSKLLSADKGAPLTKFRTGSVFDKLVIGLGAASADGFVDDYKGFSEDGLYLPEKKWKQESQYRGMSGGGGGGWGGEIAIVGQYGPVVQFAFGGGGGGGVTSSQPNPAVTPHTALGAGGGGGAQFANGYNRKGKNYNGLGLGAGAGSGETDVEYSYNDYPDSGRPERPLHQYNAPVIADYEAQLKNLADQLKDTLKKNRTVVLRGGGGMGAGTEYLDETKHEFEPHALSTQAGFQYSYEFRKGRQEANDVGLAALDALEGDQEDLYAFIGDAYRVAARQALADCGGDYSNFACICPRQHALIICSVEQKVGDPAKVPSWLQQRHCPGDADPTGGFSGYQQLLLGASGADPVSCKGTLEQYFIKLNAPVATPD